MGCRAYCIEEERDPSARKCKKSKCGNDRSTDHPKNPARSLAQTGLLQNFANVQGHQPLSHSVQFNCAHRKKLSRSSAKNAVHVGRTRRETFLRLTPNSRGKGIPRWCSSVVDASVAGKCYRTTVSTVGGRRYSVSTCLLACTDRIGDKVHSSARKLGTGTQN